MSTCESLVFCSPCLSFGCYWATWEGNGFGCKEQPWLFRHKFANITRTLADCYGELVPPSTPVGPTTTTTTTTEAFEEPAASGASTDSLVSSEVGGVSVALATSLTFGAVLLVLGLVVALYFGREPLVRVWRRRRMYVRCSGFNPLFSSSFSDDVEAGPSTRAVEQQTSPVAKTSMSVQVESPGGRTTEESSVDEDAMETLRAVLLNVSFKEEATTASPWEEMELLRPRHAGRHSPLIEMEEESEIPL